MGHYEEIGAFEAKNTLSALLDLVEAGEEVIITRHGKPVARLVPPRGALSPVVTLSRHRQADVRGLSIEDSSRQAAVRPVLDGTLIVPYGAMTVTLVGWSQGQEGPSRAVPLKSRMPADGAGQAY